MILMGNELCDKQYVIIILKYCIVNNFKSSKEWLLYFVNIQISEFKKIAPCKFSGI